VVVYVRLTKCAITSKIKFIKEEKNKYKVGVEGGKADDRWVAVSPQGR